MKMAVYKGKSPQKTLARSFAYSKVARKDFYSKSHIVIASRECGDIKFLLENGVNKKYIIACDIDPVASREAKKLGVWVSEFPDIQHTTAYYMSSGVPLASVNVDLCMTVKKGFPALVQVLARTRLETKVFFTFCRYRDGMHSTEERMEKLRKLAGIGYLSDTDALHYQSHTRSSIGSPMTVVVV